MSKPENITVEITGIPCASCAQRIESAISKTEGMDESVVNFATRKATVTSSIPAKEIHKIIEKKKIRNIIAPTFSICFNL